MVSFPEKALYQMISSLLDFSNNKTAVHTKIWPGHVDALFATPSLILISSRLLVEILDPLEF